VGLGRGFLRAQILYSPPDILMKIAVDIDDVLSEWTREFLKWCNRKYNTNWVYEDLVDYRWDRLLGITNMQAVDDVHDFQETDQFRDLPLISGAKEGIMELAKHHELHVVSGRLNGAKDITCEWLERNFPGIFKGIELINRYPRDGSKTLAKGEVCRRLGCEILIDDDTRHVESLMEYSVQVIIFNKHWNTYHRLPDSIWRADGWPEIIERVNRLASA
jgi:5'(3')-deoxyribonucleotidase